VKPWKVSEDGSTDSAGRPPPPTRARAVRIRRRSRAGDELACPPATKSACPGDSGALGKPDVSSSATIAGPCDGGALGEPDDSPSLFFGDDIADITTLPLRKTSPAASASRSPNCAMRP